MNLRVSRSMNSRYVFHGCFALPTVLISSIIMLAVLLSTAVMTTSTRVALKNQINNMQARLASEAGEAYAKACLDENNGVSQWTTDEPLRPYTDCAGTVLSDLEDYCPSTDALCSVSSQDNNKTQTTFEIGIKEESPPSNWGKISAGNLHACALSSEGTVFCWGYNDSGQLGNNSTTNKYMPVQVNGTLNNKIVTSISSGEKHNCAITTESTNNVYCWGNNSYGQLGTNSQSQSNIPTLIDFSGVLSGKKVIAISAGIHHTCALTNESVNNAYCWGSNDSGQVGDNSSVSFRKSPVAVYNSGQLSGKIVMTISAGGYHTCVSTGESTNNSYCWGNNDNGQLGDNKVSGNKSIVPVKVYVTSGPLSGKSVIAISAGGYHTCAATSDSTNNLSCWGMNDLGEVGDNTTTSRNTPVAIYYASGSALNNKKVTSISSGFTFTCVITDETTFNSYCWGYNGDGQLGDGTENNSVIPVHTYTGSGPLYNKKVTQISASVGGFTQNLFSCAVTDSSENNMSCWGWNYYGQLGDNKSSWDQSDYPVVVNTVDVYVKQLSAIGSTNSLKQDGSIWRQSNQTAQQNFADSIQEFQISFEKISSEDEFNCAIASTNKAYCWGSNANNRLGINDSSGGQRSIPTMVYNGSDSLLYGKSVSSVTTGSSHACTITTESVNNAYCWGYNDDGELGDNHVSGWYSNRPVAVYNSGVLSNKQITDISAGGIHTCALSSESTSNVYCWGYNYNGELGDNKASGNYSYVPVAVSTAGVLNGKTISAISAGFYHNCVITDESSNNAYCWGKNDYGQLGDNKLSGNQSNVPVAVNNSGYLSGKKVIAISAGQDYTCAITSESNNNTYCWGYNYYGQLGDNSTTDRLVPTPVYNSGNLASKKITSISSGYEHTCVLTDEANNNTYCWGYNYYGQLGDAGVSGNQSNVPVVIYNSGVLSGKKVTTITAGNEHTCSISDGKGYCWGKNNYGQLGINTVSDNNVPVLVFRAETLNRKTHY